MRDVCIWIAQQFFGRILREMATEVWNSFLRPCCSEMMACPKGDGGDENGDDNAEAEE